MLEKPAGTPKCWGATDVLCCHGNKVSQFCVRAFLLRIHFLYFSFFVCANWSFNVDFWRHALLSLKRMFCSTHCSKTPLWTIFPIPRASALAVLSRPSVCKTRWRPLDLDYTVRDTTGFSACVSVCCLSKATWIRRCRVTWPRSKSRILGLDGVFKCVRYVGMRKVSEIMQMASITFISSDCAAKTFWLWVFHWL